jgi:hypothetical protein
VPRKVAPPARGVWKLLARAQRFGFYEGLLGGRGHWLALGIGAWGLQRIRSASNPTEVLISEAVGAGQRVEITNLGITKAEYDAQAKAARKAQRKAQQQAQQQQEAGRRGGRRARRRARRRG